MAHTPVVGTKYEEYEVISEKVKLSADHKRMFEVRCSCGKIEFKRATHLILGKSRMCKSCSAKETARNYPMPIRRTGAGNLSGTHFLHLKQCAFVRGISFNLTPQFLWELYIQQEGKCALTGVPLCLVFSHKQQNVNWDVITASLDRKDNKLPYIESNVWWVHKRVNKIKRDYPLQEFIDWCELVSKKHGNPDPSAANSMEVAAKEQRLVGEELTNKPATSARLPYKKGR